MAKHRQVIPKDIREKILQEFSHRCAICGADRPQLHHIDENPSNNDLFNLIPLCPNCHLTDQHNPTRPIDPQKLAVFRKYKDPTILTPQFHPLFIRLQFLDAIEEHADIGVLEEQASELIDFVAMLEMGAFYADRISRLIRRPRYARVRVVGDPVSEQREQEVQKRHHRKYMVQLKESREKVYSLVIELLRFQKWPFEKNQQ